MDVFSGDTLTSTLPLEMSRTFFISVEAPETLLILQALRLVLRIKVQMYTDNEHKNIPKIQIHLRKYWICILCIDDFKILKIFNKLS